MKRLICLWAAIVCCVIMCVSAQEHMSFRGVPLDGSLEDCMNALEEKGFHRVTDWDLRNVLGSLFGEDEQPQSIKKYLPDRMKGTFTNQDVTLYLHTTQQSKNVYAITVTYERQSYWSELKAQYDNLKALLVKKYGEPTKVTETFSEGNVSDSEALYELRGDRCTWESLFESKKGEVILYLSKEQCLCVKYIDRQNNALNEQEIIDEL